MTATAFTLHRHGPLVVLPETTEASWPAILRCCHEWECCRGAGQWHRPSPAGGWWNRKGPAVVTSRHRSVWPRSGNQRIHRAARVVNSWDDRAVAAKAFITPPDPSKPGGSAAFGGNVA